MSAQAQKALSRGAAHATFVERDRHALAALRTNVAALGAAADVHRGDAFRALGDAATTVAHHAGPHGATSMTTLRLGLVQRPSTDAAAAAGAGTRPASSTMKSVKSRFMPPP